MYSVQWTLGTALSLTWALQEARDVCEPLIGGKIKGVQPSFLYLFRPGLQQRLHDRYMTLMAGHDQRSVAMIISLVHSGPTLQLRLHHRKMTVLAGHVCVQRGAAMIISLRACTTGR